MNSLHFYGRHFSKLKIERFQVGNSGFHILEIIKTTLATPFLLMVTWILNKFGIS
jgi:hypothetical protein